MWKRLARIGVILCAVPSAAQAAADPPPAQRAEEPRPAPPLGPPLRVQVNYQLTVPIDRASVDDQRTATARTHEAFYAMAARECDQLRAVLPSECRLVNLALTGGSPFVNAQNASMTFGANVTLEVSPRAGAASPAP